MLFKINVLKNFAIFRSISPYSVRIGENMDQKNSVSGYFSHSDFDIKFNCNQISYLSKYFHITSIKNMVCQKMLKVEFKEVDENICSAIKIKINKNECAKFHGLPAIVSLAGILSLCHCPLFSRVYFVGPKVFLVGISWVQFFCFFSYVIFWF